MTTTFDAPSTCRVPPRGAAGFKFGQALEDAEAACTRKGSWTGGDAPGCSEALVDVGFEARIKFGVLSIAAIRRNLPLEASAEKWPQAPASRR